MEISRMLTVSTAHITESTKIKLENNDENLIVFDKGVYGWLIYISAAIEMGNLPQDLHEIIKLAMENNCQWLCLDCDGEIIDNLPTYEW